LNNFISYLEQFDSKPGTVFFFLGWNYSMLGVEQLQRPELTGGPVEKTLAAMGATGEKKNGRRECRGPNLGDVGRAS
jgi:hypothetical protein